MRQQTPVAMTKTLVFNELGGGTLLYLKKFTHTNEDVTDV